jgi:hypothetical protein
MADGRTKKPFVRKSPMPSGYDWPSLLKRDYIVIIHCTQKMAIKLPGVSATPLAETSPLGSWHAHLYTYDRRQCVLFCHDESRYCLFLPGLVKEERLGQA